MIKDQDENSYVVEVNGNPGSKIIDITGYNYFQDLVAHIETKVGRTERKEAKQDHDSDSAQAQLASLEAKQDRGERMSVFKVGLMGAFRRILKMA